MGSFQSLPLPISFFLSVMSGWAERTQTHTGGALKTRAALYLFTCAHGGVSWTGMGCITDTAAAFSFNTIFQASLSLTKLSPASHWTIPQLLGSLNCAITTAEKDELNLISNDAKELLVSFLAPSLVASLWPIQTTVALSLKPWKSPCWPFLNGLYICNYVQIQFTMLPGHIWGLLKKTSWNTHYERSLCSKWGLFWSLLSEAHSPSMWHRDNPSWGPTVILSSSSWTPVWTYVQILIPQNPRNLTTCSRCCQGPTHICTHRCSVHGGLTSNC